MRYLWAVALAVLALACGKTPTDSPGGGSGQDPFYIIIIRPVFTNLYPAIDIRLAVNLHAIADSGNPDPNSIPPDVSIPGVGNNACPEMLSGNNGNGVRMHVIVSLIPTNRSTDSVVAVYQSDTLDVSPDTIPYPAPWGLDPYHLLLWKLKITDESSPLPGLLQWQLDTISFERLTSREFREDGNGCRQILP